MDSGFAETITTQLEWKLTGLKKIFESSKGDTKSKVIRSVRFGGGKWQILFYPNSGTDGGTHVSLYLSCDPTSEEKEKAVNGRWVREGLFKFSFELRNVSKTVLFNSKEACDHSFSWKTANWGWAQFARRDTVYFQANSIKTADAFTIICVITSSPITPTPLPPFPLQSVPRDLMISIGNLLDDPLYSDVEFVLPSRQSLCSSANRKIYAMKRLLSRTDYFNIMLNTGFAEGGDNPDNQAASVSSPEITPVELDDADTVHMFPSNDMDDDSDYEEDEETSSDSDEEAEESETHNVTETPAIQITPESGALVREADKDDYDTITSNEGEDETEIQQQSGETKQPNANSSADADNHSVMSWKSAIASESSLTAHSSQQPVKPEKEVPIATLPGPAKVRIVVKDVAYRTYLAMLNYLYTDIITFAPLSSSFTQPLSAPSPGPGPSSPLPTSNGAIAPVSARTEGSSQSAPTLQSSQSQALLARTAQQADNTPPGPRTRREWLKEWRLAHENERVEPCSAKAMYKLADKLALLELKNRAFQHIVKSMTIYNVPHEMFSSFSARFDEVRKVQVEFFLGHWSEIRGSEAMRSVWQQIRNGSHPGFEEVWPVIAMNLEFKPSPQPEDGDEHEGLHD